MNIKQHIEAGHYPKDDKGRALVPTRSGRMATVALTDAPGEWPLMGWWSKTVMVWRADGFSYKSGGTCLAPPASRKVTVKRWAVVGGVFGTIITFISEDDARGWVSRNSGVVFELVGEYEGPW